jgi:hypothetical protein
MAQTPACNCNAYANRFARSIKKDAEPDCVRLRSRGAPAGVLDGNRLDANIQAGMTP